MTVGIISNPERKLDGRRFIQTNASVNPGNSGGPLLDKKGNLIGIITLKANIEGVGFAVPHDVLRDFLKKCLK